MRPRSRGRAVLRRLLPLLLIVLLGAPAQAQPAEGFALVLGGGGAKGLAHVGVLRALEELGLRPSLIVGTSMGAVVGSLYAAGLSAAELEELAGGVDWYGLMTDDLDPPGPNQAGWSGLPPHQILFRLDRFPPKPRTGASFGQAVETLVGIRTAEALFAARNDFDRLPIPFRCVTTDVMTAEPVVFSSGVLARIVRASLSLPVIYVPVRYEGRTLMDGGLVDNLPVALAREMGFEHSVIVDVSNVFLPQSGPPEDVFELLRRAGQLSQLSQNRVETRDGDVMLRVDLRGHSTLSFSSGEEIIERGYRSTMEQADALRALARRHPPPPPGPERPAVPDTVLIRRVVVRGQEKMSAWGVRKRLDVVPGDRLPLEELWRRADTLARQSVFHNVWLEIVPVDEGVADLRVNVIERWRPELELAANFVTDRGAGLLARLRLDNYWGTGGARALSWRITEKKATLDLAATQPIRGSRFHHLRLGAGWGRETVDLYRDGDDFDAWAFRREWAQLDLAAGLPPLPLNLLLGFRIENARRYRESRRAGSAGFHRLRALHLGLESGLGGGIGSWPARGLSVHYLRGAPGLGGDVEQWRLEAGLRLRQRVLRRWGFEAGTGWVAASSDLPEPWLGRAGGARGWIGLHEDEVLAPHLFWQRLGLDYYIHSQLRVNLAGAVGWSGSRSLDGTHPRWGIGASVVLETVAGPIRLGVEGSRGGGRIPFVQVGYEF